MLIKCFDLILSQYFARINIAGGPEILGIVSVIVFHPLTHIGDKSREEEYALKQEA